MNITHRAKEKYRKDGLAALLKSGIRFTISYVRRYLHNKKNSLYYKSHKLVRYRFPLPFLAKMLFGVLFLIDNIDLLVRKRSVIIPNSNNFDIVDLPRQKKLLTVPRVSDKKRCWSYDRLRSAFTKKGFVEIEPDDIVFDVGAHIGVFSTVAAENADHVVAIDPNASIDRCLYINTKEYSNISVIDKAAWKESTELELKKGYFPSENSSLDVDSYDLRETFTVKADTVAQIASDQDIDTIDFLKVEAEGAEPEILKGALCDGIRINKIAVDCSPERFGENTHSQIIPMLKEHGYDISIRESNPSYVFGRKTND